MLTLLLFLITINIQEILFLVREELSESPRIIEWLRLEETPGDQLHVSMQTMRLTSEDHHMAYFASTCDSDLELSKLHQIKP